jgi:MFS transporter, Spinster family, sphingosine-1-phosphate transporter
MRVKTRGLDRSPNFILGFLTLVVFLNYLDRYVLAILIEPIKAELRLTDTQIGLLTGAGFALLYSVMAIPIARLAERRNRMNILMFAALVWSLATFSSGFATGFAALLLARIVVGCGEAGGVPPTLSMIADLYSTRKRATAMAIFGMGGSAGAALAPLLGGWLEAHLGWRQAFFVIGAAGVPIALTLLALKEPERGAADEGSITVTALPFRRALERLFKRRSFAWLMPALIAMALAEYSLLLWIPTLFHRSFGLGSTDLGSRITLFQGVPFFIGTLLGGIIADRLRRRDERWIVWVPMLGALAAVPGVICMLAVRELNLALALLTVPSLVSGLYVGPCYALIQNLAAAHSRATAAAVLALVVNLIGAGLGPLMLGAVSDLLRLHFGEDSLRQAFFVLVPLYLCAALSFRRIDVNLRRDMEDVRHDTIVGGPT